MRRGEEDEAPEGIEFHADPGEGGAAGAVRLLAGTYWNEGEEPDRIRAAQLGSSAWVVARAAAPGRVVGTARAISDGARKAWIYDVAVDESWRGGGVGKALLRRLLDHPRIRGVRQVHLSTRDAQDFYRAFEFLAVPPGAGPGTTMVRQAIERLGGSVSSSAKSRRESGDASSDDSSADRPAITRL